MSYLIDPLYIWQSPDWPAWRYDAMALAPHLARVHQAQGHLRGRMDALGMAQRDQAALQVVTEDVLKTSEIEGEHLDRNAVRSSIARRLGVDIGALAPVDRHVEGVVDMVLDATGRHAEPLTVERLLGWHAALFPTGYSGMSPSRVGAWRDDASGPMQVVSGSIGRRKVHYEAPPAGRLEREIDSFLRWLDGVEAAGATHGDPVLRAGLALLWLVTLHPFDDGNGRISRAVGDLMLARAEHSPQRFYSLSGQIERERKDYYAQLEATQKGDMDVTVWLRWFLDCLLRAIEAADATIGAVLVKATFWQRWAGTPMNERQLKLLNRLLDGFEGKLTTAKWAAIAKCSADTALRDISDLVGRGVLVRSEAGGRSTSYVLAGTDRAPD